MGQATPKFVYRRGFTLVELLVVIAIIGILIALLLPAVQSARESARRTQCNSQPKQVGLALQMHHDAQKTFPKGRTSTNEFGVAWSYLILPYLEEQAMYDARDPSQPVHADINAGTFRSPIDVYACPSRRSAAADRDFDNNDQGANANGAPRNAAVLGDYAANAGLEEDTGMEENDFRGGKIDKTIAGPIYSNSSIRQRHIIDGMSKTFAVGEKHLPPLLGDWDEAFAHSGQGDTCFLAGDKIDTILRGTEDGMASNSASNGVEQGGNRNGAHMFGSEHPGVVLFVFCDGHTEALATSRTGYADMNPNRLGDVPNPADPDDFDEIQQWGWFFAMSTIAGEEIISE